MPQLPPSHLRITRDQMRKKPRGTKVKKATGPNAISSRFLMECADQLSEVVQNMFNLSLSLVTVPILWKTTCVVPVPKMAHPSEQRHYRLVALTSHLMKTLERIVLGHLCTLVSSTLRFANRPGIGVDDAIIYCTRCICLTQSPPGSMLGSCFLTSPVFSMPSGHRSCG